MSAVADMVGRILRAGDQLSKTNQKLREAVEGFVALLYSVLGEYNLPDPNGPNGIGWALKVERNGLINVINLSFKQQVGGWQNVYSPYNLDSMWPIYAFCQTLAGPGGEQLVSRLERTTFERRQYRQALEAFKSVLQKPPVDRS